MKTYKLLKDLPGIPAGTIGEPCDNGNIFRKGCSGPHYLYYTMENYPDFFEEVKEEEKLFTLSDMRRFHEVHKYNPNMNFQALMLNALHIEID